MRTVCGMALWLALIAGAMAAAPACKVIDPELQGGYSGPCVDGFAQGEGMAKGMASYRGGFVAGRKHGAGVKAWPNGDRYEGEFADDLKHGHGVYVWGPRTRWAGERYTGRFERDRRHGAGIYEWPDGRRLAGQWRADMPPTALPPAMQATVRATAEQLIAASRPGATVCREVAVGIAQIDRWMGVVRSAAGDRISVQVTQIGKFSDELDGRKVAVGAEISGNVGDWYACR